MKFKLLLTSLLVFCFITINAAPFKNVEKILIQPDGTELHCYASGDEFYSRLHDKDGYTIIQAESGYFVYATKNDQGEIIATQHIAGKSDPKSLGLVPNIKISQKDYFKRRDNMKTTPMRDHSGLNHGVYNNLVVFIKFQGDTDLKTTQAKIDSMFNNNGYYDISMNNYFRKATYDQLAMKSFCYPKADGNKVIAYEDIYPRNYYRPYNANSNPDGYQPEERGPREFALLKRAIEYIAPEVPDTLNLDRNNDGLIDNVIFVVKGNVSDWSDLLWPHMWEMHGEEAYIHNKRVGSFNFQLETSTYFTVSTLCHEMAHSLGFPDLYHYEENYDHLSPTGPWDLMCNNSNPPQHSTAYMKYKYGTWIDDIPVIDYGTYTLEANSWEGGRRNCYKIPSSDPDQFYLLEYRNKDNIFEKGLPDGGLLIYRLDRRFNGCIYYNGDKILDELYIFRPGGTAKKDGNINSAAFSADANKTQFNSNTDPYPFLNKDKRDYELNICNISAKGDQLTFSYLPINSDIIPTNLIANVKKGKYVELKWDTVAKADSYNVYRDGEMIASNVAGNSYNDEYQNIEDGHHYYFVSSNAKGEESFRSEEENIIIGDYCVYTFDMNCTGDNGWQGGEIKLSFSNEMKDKYLTMYSGSNKTEDIVVPANVEMSVEWTSGWNDTECSFVITNNEQEVYKSEILEEGLLITLKEKGCTSCVQPQNLTASVSGYFVDLNWNSLVESDGYMIMRNNEVIAENITNNFYTDKTISGSGTFVYTVMSQKEDCTSSPSNTATVTLFNYDRDFFEAEANYVDNAVKLDWKFSSNGTHTINYDDGVYVTSIGSSSNTWGIRIPVESLGIYKDAKITAVEIFDATEATYTFNIYNGEKPDNNSIIHTESFKTTNSRNFVTFNLSKEISFDNSQDLWLSAKSAGSSSEPIPCGNFIGLENSNMLKVGASWKSASNYSMNYSWLIRLHIQPSDGLADMLSYNVYKENEIIASNLKSTTYIDSDVKYPDTVCYNIGVIYNNATLLYSNDICLTITSSDPDPKPEPEPGEPDPEEPDDEDKSPKLYPNPTNDYITICDDSIKKVEIYSVTGNILLEKDTNCNELQINMKTFRDGIYLVHVITETETKVYKVVVY